MFSRAFTKMFKMICRCRMNFVVTLALFLVFYSNVMAQVEGGSYMIECVKKDECSCVTKNKPQREISLWKINGDKSIMESFSQWYYDVNLCHGVHKNSSKRGEGCANATVCQYDKKLSVFEVGSYGTARFGDYDNNTKSIKVHYSGTNGNTSRSISINLQCDSNGNVSRANYSHFRNSILSETQFVGTITTKAACLSPVKTVPDQPVRNDRHGGLSTEYIAFITIGSVLVLCICCFISYALIAKRKKSILEDEMNEDYGTNSKPSVHVQNAFSNEPAQAV